MSRELNKYSLLNIFKKTCFNRFFELSVAKYNDSGHIRSPVYLSIGQEHIPAILSEFINPEEWLIFTQHRCHSYHLSFGTPPNLIAEELLGIPNAGLHGGTCGSASLDYKNIFGHSGMLGDQVPIAVGAAHASGKKTLCILGDGAAEEDYVLGALGLAATKKAPVLFICEDNNLSVLTEKKVRRSWEIYNVAKSLGFFIADNIGDRPKTIYDNVKYIVDNQAYPALLNVNVCRHMWHAGTGTDGPPKWDTYQNMQDELWREHGILTNMLETEIQKEVDDVWKEALKKL